MPPHAPPDDPELALAEEPQPGRTAPAASAGFGSVRALRYRLDRLIGESPAARRAAAQVELAVGSRASVLLVGPPGSGRQHVADAIHYGGDPGCDRLRWCRWPVRCWARYDRIDRPGAGRESRAGRQKGRHTLLLNEVDQLPQQSQRSLAELVARPPVPLRLIATAAAFAAGCQPGRSRFDRNWPPC